MRDIDVLVRRILLDPSLGTELNDEERFAVEKYIKVRWPEASPATAESLAQLMSLVPSLTWLDYLDQLSSRHGHRSHKLQALTRREDEIRCRIAEALAADGSNAPTS